MAEISGFHVYRSSDGGVSSDVSAIEVFAEIFLTTNNTSKLQNASLVVEASTQSFTSSNFMTFDLGTSFGVTSPSNLNTRKVVSLGPAFKADTKYYFTLRFYDGTSFATPAYDSVLASSVPIMVAKNNFSVAVGGKASGSAGSPKFYVHWPSYFSGGVQSFGSPWVPLESRLTSGVTTPGTYGNSLRCRRIENKCIIDGTVKVKPGSSTVVLCELPDDLKPTNSVFALNPCEGVDNPRIARIAVGGTYDTNPGMLCLSWVKNIKDGSTYTGEAIWVQCNIEYWLLGYDNG